MTEPADPEELRRRYRYRTLILRGKLHLSLVAARALVGPDCAYHLYRAIGAGAHVDRDPTPCDLGSESAAVPNEPP